jgi:hypothetical protein
MNDLVSNGGASTVAGLRGLNGRVVLVKTSRDHRNPPTGIRGWLEVRDSASGEPEVCVAVEFPQMFSRRAHRKTISLDRAALGRLLESERNGTLAITIDDDLT